MNPGGEVNQNTRDNFMFHPRRLGHALLLSILSYLLFFLLVKLFTGSIHGVIFFKAFVVWLLLTLYFYLFSSRSAICILVLIQLLLISPFLYYSGWNFSNRSLSVSFYGMLTISIALSSLLLVNLSSIEKSKTKFVITLMVRALKGVIILFLALYSTVNFSYWWVTGKPLQSDAILAVFQSNLNEIIGYLSVNFSPLSLIALFFALTSLCLILFQLVRNISKLQNKTSGHDALIILFLAIPCFIYIKVNGPLFSPYKGAFVGLAEYAQFKQEVMKRQNLVNNLHTINSVQDGLYMIVIGESQSRLRMNLYGYERETSPWLSSQRNNPYFVFCNNAFSNHTHTVPALQYALTGQNQYSEKVGVPYSILDVVKAAGFKTYWLSNQVRISAWDTPISVISSTAAEQKFINGQLGTNVHTSPLDGNLLNELYRLKDLPKKTLIVLHLMGNHSPYKVRYPDDPKWEKYDGGGESKYDNSLIYTDYITEKVLDWAIRQPNFKFLVYFSDHGEDMKKGHDSSNINLNMVAIPLWFAFSKTYVEHDLQHFETLKKNRNQPFTNDLIFDTVLGLMGFNKDEIETLGYESIHDLSTQAYSKNLSQLLTLHGKKHIQDLQLDNNGKQ